MKLPDHKQRGVALLLLLLVVLIVGATVTLGALNSRPAASAQEQLELSHQMQLAKEALLAFAANSSVIHGNGRGPGYFPCPDTSNTGVPDLVCDSSPVNLGRLPKHATDMNDNRILIHDYYAAVGTQFWYAVAPAYVYATDLAFRNALNRTSIDVAIASSRLTVDGTGNIVAVILAPGESLGSQDRASGPLVPGNFLEGDNADFDQDFVSSGADPAATNDQILVISHAELMAYIGNKVATEAKRILDDFYDAQPAPGNYPANQTEFAALLASHPWLGDVGSASEQWASNITYTQVADTEASLIFNGCPNLSFTLHYAGGITSDGSSC